MRSASCCRLPAACRAAFMDGLRRPGWRRSWSLQSPSGPTRSIPHGARWCRCSVRRRSSSPASPSRRRPPSACSPHRRWCGSGSFPTRGTSGTGRLLALSRIRNFGERDLASDLLVGLISLGLAAATHHLVERPIRRWYRMRTKRLGWRPVFAGVAMGIAAAVGGFQAFQALARNGAAEIDPAFAPKSAKLAGFCDLMSQSAGDCLAMSAGRPLGLLIGDSLMLAARNVLAGHAEAGGSLAVSLAAPGCVALFGVRIFTEDSEMTSGCARRKDNALPQLRAGAIRPEYAILYSRWQIYAAGPATIAFGPEEAVAPAVDEDELFITALRRTIAELKSFGVQRILVLNPSPLFPRSVPNCLSLADRSGLDKAKACGVDRATAEAERHTPSCGSQRRWTASRMFASPIRSTPFATPLAACPMPATASSLPTPTIRATPGWSRSSPCIEPISIGPWAASHDSAGLTLHAGTPGSVRDQKRSRTCFRSSDCAGRPPVRSRHRCTPSRC